MNYKKAITQITKEKVLGENIKTFVQPVVKYSEWEGRNGWVKITSSYERVPVKKPGDADSDVVTEKISLEGFVRLQERRMVEYDSTRWEGAFRELYPIYPPYPENENEYDEEDGQYYSDSDYNNYSDPEY